MAVLVTGGLGYIGAHTVVALVARGYEVVIVDNLHNSRLQVLADLQELTGCTLPFYQVDVTDELALEAVFRRHDLQAVVHVAGYKSVGDSLVQPLSYYRTNILGTLTVARLCAKYEVFKVIFSSSASVYGNGRAPFLETDVVQALHPYAASKVMAERILQDLTKSEPRFSVHLLRYFNPVGAHPSGVIGDESNGKSTAIMPLLTAVACGLQTTLPIFGCDYDTVDGTAIRDYVHVQDVAEAHVIALQQLQQGAHILNVGTGQGISVKMLVETFQRVNAVVVPHTFTARRAGDMAVCYANTEKLQQLGWRATRDVETMCRDAWRFAQRRQTVREH